MDVPLIHVGDYDLAITPWTSTYGSHRMDVDDILPPLPLTPTRRPRSPEPENLQALGLVISGMPPHLFAMYWMLLPRIFANICQLRDVYADRSDYSLRANTFAELESIPRLVYVGIRKVGQSGPYVQLWPFWIQPYHLPPADPQAVEQHENGNYSNNRTLLRLCYTIPSNNCRSYCRYERSLSLITSLP